MDNLNAVLNILREKKDGFCGKFYVPSRWNCFGYKNFTVDSSRPGEIGVNPYDFILSAADKILSGEKNDPGGEPISLTDNIIYSMLPRSFTAWPHYRRDEILDGTFLKALALLPGLTEFGISVLYLLPVFRRGSRYKKGEIGSPYAIKDFYRLDENLHDSLLGDYSEELLETEFKAFVEACHLLGIKVVVDFAFRTAARDSVLIFEHPDWFYWIKKENCAFFKTPAAKDGKTPYHVDKQTVKLLYSSPETAGYLSQFTLPPNEIDAQKWEQLKSGGSQNIEEKIEEAFGITTAPGFSDVINDRQPAWTDVTYLKYYFDSPKNSLNYVPKQTPPYIMQDGASLNAMHGSKKNEALFDYIENILPFYYKNYGIDGARIDMAHALPEQLNKKIISAIKSVCPQFILWSEELDPAASQNAKQSGFDFISGFSYASYKKAGKASFNHSILEKCFLKATLPLTASVETPDTPRCAEINQNPARLAQLFILNSFMPNSIPMINSGQALFEKQPMNLGLDNDESGRFVLPENDKMYGKLAFFDHYCLHWTRGSDALKIFCDIAKIRHDYRQIILGGSFIRHPKFGRSKKLTVLHYRRGSANFIIAANRCEKTSLFFDIREIAEYSSLKFIYDGLGHFKNIDSSVVHLRLRPLETVIIEAF